MANRSYLCGTDTKTIYPSFVHRGKYKSEKQTIACDVWCVPLLWTGLFRADDVVAETFNVDGETVHAEAPLTLRKRALSQLKAALPFFNRLFVKEGPLDAYADFLRQALEAVSFKYVTIEMEEIACLVGTKKFYAMFRKALASIGDEPSKKTKELFVEIAAFRKLRRFPPADIFLDPAKAKKATRDDEWNWCRVCGAGACEAGIGRPVPWEPKP